jgi:outer membrane immunogenic protein
MRGKSLILGIAVVTLVGPPALAADLESRPAPVLSPIPNWSGPYIGAGVGGRFNAVDGNVTAASVGTPPVPINLRAGSPGYTNPAMWWGSQPGAMQYLDHIAIGARIYAGWDFQVTPNYIVGLEGDFAYANETSVFHGSPYPVNMIFGTPSLPFGASSFDLFRVRTTWDASARLRAGWLVTPAMLVYLTAGLAWTRLEAESTCTSKVGLGNVSNCAPGNYFSGTLGPEVITNSAVQLGWTAGTGMEFAFARHWIVRAQYRFSDFGYPSGGTFRPFSFTDTRVCSGCPSAASPLTVSYELPVMMHSFEVGLAYKFQ